MQRSFYRRVWQWKNNAWSVVDDGPILSWDVTCIADKPSFCSIGPPYIFERWWVWEINTWGSSPGYWRWVSDEQNW